MYGLNQPRPNYGRVATNEFEKMVLIVGQSSNDSVSFLVPVFSTVGPPAGSDEPFCPEGNLSWTKVLHTAAYNNTNTLNNSGG